DANSMRYRASCEKKFPGVYHNELRRALLYARNLLGLVKERPHQKGPSSLLKNSDQNAICATIESKAAVS
ncbi:MAG TPA: hypothetical protein VFK06_09820, partial [Candidatus Angelobacter sp.]|nr:hypothetical protein [Candidatus Angelobacter sp.]